VEECCYGLARARMVAIWVSEFAYMYPDRWLRKCEYSDQPSPYASTPLSQLSSSQPYEIYLSLQLPATEANLALGNFMIDLRLADAKSNQTLAYSRRPVSLVVDYTSTAQA